MGLNPHGAKAAAKPYRAWAYRGRGIREVMLRVDTSTGLRNVAMRAAVIRRELHRLAPALRPLPEQQQNAAFEVYRD